MPDQFKSFDLEFQQIFGKNNRLVVPEFQRSYSWGTEQVQTLWDDLIDYWFTENQSWKRMPEYFLGSVVTVEDEDGTEMLLDGQQRLATLTILSAVIRDALKRIGDEKAVSIANNTQQSLITRSAAWELSQEYKLVLNRQDRSFFEQLVQREEQTKATAEPRLLSHKLIARAKRTLEKAVGSFLQGISPDAALERLQILVRGVASSTVLIKIKLQSEDEASRIFEVLNDRGLDLGTEDLLRNYLLKAAVEGDREPISNYWDDILGRFSKGGIQAFIRHSWISRHDTVSKKDTYKSIKAYLREHPSEILNFAVQLAYDSAVYASMTGDASGITELREASARRELLAFGLLRARQCMPLLLAVFECASEVFVATLRRVNVITLRYNICERNPNQLENVYSDLAREIRNADEGVDVAAMITAKLAVLCPSDDEFADNFERVVVDRSEMQRYLLGEIEREIGKHAEFEIAGSATVHVEHIYPQNPGKGWPKLVSNHNALGNLTLLSGVANREVSNHGFAVKAVKYAESEIVITRSLAELVAWDDQAVAERQKLFARLAIKIWKF